MKTKVIVSLTLLFLTLQAFAFNSIKNPQKSALPAAMPADAAMKFVVSGGFAPTFKSIVVSDGRVFVEQRTIQDRELKKWYAEISDAEQKAVYRAFVEYKFDLIENEKPKNTVYDVPTETISIVVNGKSFSVSSGLNAPLSTVNEKRYQAVKDALNRLEDKYKFQAKQIAHEFAVIKYEQKAHGFLFKNAKPAALNASELARIDKSIDSAISDFNQAKKDDQKIVNLQEYKFQFVPVQNNSGEKEVFVNAFCTALENDWHSKLIIVDDGGNCFFNFKINLKTFKIYDFQVNGVA